MFGWWNMYLQNLDVPFSINGAFSDVQDIHAMCTNTPIFYHRCWLWKFVLLTIWIVLFLFKHKGYDVHVQVQSDFTLCISPSQASSGPKNSAAFLGVVDIAFALHLQLQRQTVLTINWFPRPYNDSHEHSVLVFDLAPCVQRFLQFL